MPVSREKAETPLRTAVAVIGRLSEYLYKYYGRKVIILLDEYDTPLQEADVNGYWNELTAFIREFFNSAFNSNPWLERAVMKGITIAGRESVFSDLNNLEVVSVTSDKYKTVFGFTEEEVILSLEEYGLTDQKEEVKSGMIDLFSGILEIFIIPGPLQISRIKGSVPDTGPIPAPMPWSAG